MTLTMMCGLPNSGKTTKANNIAEETGATIIRVDDYTHLYQDGYKPNQILEIVINDTKSALECGENVVYDAVNATKSERKQLFDNFSTIADVVCVYMDTPAEMCVSRDKHGWSSIYARFFEVPTTDEGFELVCCKDGVDKNFFAEQNILDVLLGVTE